MQPTPDPIETPQSPPPHDGVGGDNDRAGMDSGFLSSHMVGLDTLIAVASQLTDGVCVLTPGGHIRFANAALRAMLGRSEAELLGQRLEQFRENSEEAPGGASTPSRKAAKTAPRRGAELVTVGQWRRSDGGLFEARCVVQPLAHGILPSSSIALLTPIEALASAPGQQDAARPRKASANARAAAGRWVEVIEAVADVALAKLPVDDLIEAMLNRIQPALGAENAAVLLINDAGDALETRGVAGVGRELANMVRLPLDAQGLGGVLMAREPRVMQDGVATLRETGLFPEALLETIVVSSMLLTPLIVDDQVTGLLYLGARDHDHFTGDDIRLARVAGARIALAVEGARARAEAAQARRRLVLLTEASQTLVGPLDPQEIVARLLSLVAPAYASACALYLVEEDGVIRRVATSAPATGDGDAASVSTQGAARALELLPPETESFETLESAARASIAAGSNGARLTQITQVSVTAHGHPLGALLLVEEVGRQLEEEDLRLVDGLARRAAVGMEIARLYAELEQALRQVSESAIQLGAIFDSTDAGIIVTNAEGRYTRINSYGLRMLGLSETGDALYPAPERGAYEFRDERGQTIPPDEEPLTRARVGNQPVERRILIHRYDTGRDIPAIARCTPMRDGRGEVIGAVGALMDITGIDEIERQKDEFLGIVSHELKTPLTTLKILAQMLTRRMRASGETRAQEQAERMTTAIVRMERLINDLLDVSRIQEGKLTLTLTVCDLDAICRDVAREEEITSQRDIHLSLPDRESLPIHADMERLRQVVVNLLSNALKYSPPNTPVWLRVRETDVTYVVSVEDRGPGLPEAERRRLFHRFYRAPGVKVQSGSGVGLGLGLFISQEIVRNHGGEIWVESKLGHGSVFSFSVPRASASDGDDLDATVSEED